MDTVEILNVVIGLLELGFGVLVLAYLGRFGRDFPWLLALMIFFVVRGIDRVYVGLEGESRGLNLVTDAVVVATLLLLIFGLRHTIDRLQRARDHAAGAGAEYERALGDYRTVVRHRIANRVHAIRGAVQTLAESETLDAETRAGLLRMLDEESRRLEEEALGDALYSASRQGSEESGLRPRPRFRRARGT